MPHWLQPRSIYVVPVPTCIAWRSRCRFQEPSAAISLNPQQNTHSPMEPAIMMISQWCPLTKVTIIHRESFQVYTRGSCQDCL